MKIVKKKKKISNSITIAAVQKGSCKGDQENDVGWEGEDKREQKEYEY